MVLDCQTNEVFIAKQTLDAFPIVTRRVETALNHFGIAVKYLNHCKYSWCRDYMPIQVAENKFVQYRYFPDYMDNDKYRSFITDPTETLQELGIETVKTDLIIDGGNVVKCKDCAIMVDKVFQENPTRSETEIRDELERLFECEVIFIPFDKAEYYGHADGVVRFISDNKVLLTNYADYDHIHTDKILNVLTKHFEVETLHYEVEQPNKFSWAYINFLQTADALLVPTFGIDEDAQAIEQIRKLYPKYKNSIQGVKVNSFVRNGGALNCISWNILR